MIRLEFVSCRWGTEAVKASDGAEGRQINLLDVESQILANVPFTGPPLLWLITELSLDLSPEDRAAAIEAIGNAESLLPPDEPEEGPQG